MALKPGQGTNPAADTMAAAMVEAFKHEWPKFMDSPLPDEVKLASLKHLFVAVSQGVVQHLRDNPEALKLVVSASGGGGAHTHAAAVASIETSGTTN